MNWKKLTQGRAFVLYFGCAEIETSHLQIAKKILSKIPKN